MSLTYTQIEDLLSKLPLLKALMGNMQSDFKKRIFTQKTAQENNRLTAAEILYTLTVGNKVLSDMPFSGSFSQEKVTGTILAKDRVIREIVSGDNVLDDDMVELKNDIQEIGAVIDKVIDSLEGLPIDEGRCILIDFYCEKKTWKDLSIQRGIEKGQAQTVRRKAIESMIITLKVTSEQYEFCVKRLEREG